MPTVPGARVGSARGAIPRLVLVQMSRAIDAAVKFQTLHNGMPQHAIANDLQIRSEDEDFCAGLQSGRVSVLTLEAATSVRRSTLFDP